MSDDQPTEQFSPLPAEGPEPDDNDESQFKKYFFILLGAVAVLAVLIAALIARGNDDTKDASDDATVSSTPTASDSDTTPSTSEPTEAATTTAPPASTGPKVNKFTSTNSVRCNTESPETFPQHISFSWSTTGAAKVYLGVDTSDASAAPLFTDLPASGDQNDFPAGYSPFEYNCPQASQSFTLTIVGDGGQKVSKTVTVVNNGDTE